MTAYSIKYPPELWEAIQTLHGFRESLETAFAVGSPTLADLLNPTRFVRERRRPKNWRRVAKLAQRLRHGMRVSDASDFTWLEKRWALYRWCFQIIRAHDRSRQRGAANM